MNVVGLIQWLSKNLRFWIFTYGEKFLTPLSIDNYHKIWFELILPLEVKPTVMLHFFRKIRRELLANSKCYRYLKYGIGEIGF